MSKLREAAQAAVAAFGKHGYSPLTVRAIWNLRDALAEPDETEAAVLAEREACAEAAEEWLPDSFEEITQVAIAAEIRERGQE